MKASTKVTLSELNAAFYYDETSKSCLRFKVDKWKGRKHSYLSFKAGDEAGSKHAHGYWITKYEGVQVKCHRVAYMLYHQVELGPDDEIDHEDGDRGNNRHWNLRRVDTSINARNCSKSRKNTSGVTGVSFHTNKSGNLYAKAQWNDLETGARQAKYFSVEAYGVLPAFAMAHRFREQKIEELNTNGAGYTERHGK